MKESPQNSKRINMELKDIRVKIDQMSEGVLSGLKNRSRYSLNLGTSLEEFYAGKTWFEYRLLKEQGLDSEFGRYVFEDQQPLLFRREQLPGPLRKRNAPKIGVVNVGIDVGNRVTQLYRQALEKICSPGENENDFGEVTKLDVSNVLTLYERICGLGQEVAAIKIQTNPEIVYLDKETIREKLRNPVREQEVVDSAAITAERYQLAHSEIVPQLFRDIINITVDVEVDYVLGVRRIRDNEPRIPPGFGQVPRKAERRGIGFGQV